MPRGERPGLLEDPRIATQPVACRCGALALSLLGAACGGPGPTPSPPAPGPQPSAAGAPSRPGPPPFVERAAALGLEFMHFNGMTGAYYMAEVTGSGGALFDYDQDGDLDLYLLQGQLLGPGKTLAEAVYAPAYPTPLTDRLYRNDLHGDGGASGTLHFTDVTEASGLAAYGYGMGVATGDYDNDGRVDLYVTNYGPNQLLANVGGGRFVDRTTASGTQDERWSVPVVFFDYDRDGWLDLFVGNYIAADPVHRPICRDFTGAEDYCGPGAFPAEPDRLFHNRGDGTFTDVTHAAGLRQGFGAALGVVAADFNGDGWPDLYVANDSMPNNLWLNQQDGTFRDEALLAGCSVNAAGKAEASMGLDAGDFDGDGDFDLFMTHLTAETNTFFRNDGNGLFDDGTLDTGLGPPSRPYTSFGTAALDYDNDGWLDLIVVNGAVKKIEALARAQDPFPVHQPNQLFHNLGDGRFEEVTADAGEAFRLSEVSRGAIVGDVDDDGDPDVVVVNNSGPVRLLLNQVGQRRHWLGLAAVGGDPPRTMLGARLAVVLPGGRTLVRRVHTDGSFASACDPRVLVGLGDAEQVEEVRVEWPDGSIERWRGLALDRYHTLRRGAGSPAGEAP